MVEALGETVIAFLSDSKQTGYKRKAMVERWTSRLSVQKSDRRSDGSRYPLFPSLHPSLFAFRGGTCEAESSIKPC